MLGEILLRNKLLTSDQLDRALATSRNTRTRLGDVLVSEGMSYPELYRAVAEHFALPYVNLIAESPEFSLLDSNLTESYLQHLTLPYHKEAGILTLATAEYSDEVIAWAKRNYGENVRFVITSPRDIRHAISQHCAAQLTEQSVMRLYDEAPVQSARYNNSLPALLVLIMMSLFIIAAPLPPLIATLALCHMIYTLTMLFKVVIYVAGSLPIRGRARVGAGLHNSIEQNTNASALDAPLLTSPLMGEGFLPTYSILIPMYHETESLQGMLAAMQAMDYPPAKLDIKLIFEEDDEQMLQAAYALKPHYHFDIIRVPKSAPRTKPKACNYALNFARGEYVTVYDADDRPDPKQLKKAVAAFRSLPPDVICLQARLGYYNTHDNLLTRLFSLEYTMLFRGLLRGMQRLKMPLMLGGTSNHFPLARLRTLGEWDPFNVTEDADLGTRLAARGYKTAMIDSDTMEEAPNELRPWLKQRTRWIKGYMQTWLVHMRRPLYLYKNLRGQGFIGFQCFVALANFCYLTAPLAWLATIVTLPPWLLWLLMINLIAYVTIHISIALHATRFYTNRKHEMRFAALLYPLYLALHSIASYIALWQLLAKPHIWNKTTHGKARTFAEKL